MKGLVGKLLSIATLATWAGILLHVYLSGRINHFLAPPFRPWVLVAGVALAVLLIGWLLGGVSEEDSCCQESCAHTTTRSLPARFLAFSILVIPIAVAAWAAPAAYSGSTVTNRGVVSDSLGLPPAARNATGSATPQPAPATGQATTPDNGEDEFIPKTADGKLKLEVIDLLYAAQDPGLRAGIENKTVEVIGQMMPAATGNAHGGRFKVVRMFMTCCAADARPVAALVQAPEVPNVPEMSWVRVRGRATFPTEAGRQVAVIESEKTEVTDPPEETMLY